MFGIVLSVPLRQLTMYRCDTGRTIRGDLFADAKVQREVQKRVRDAAIRRKIGVNGPIALL